MARPKDSLPLNIMAKTESAPQTLDTDSLRRQRPWRSRLKKFIQTKPLGAAGALFLIFLFFVAIFADLLQNYDPQKSFYWDSVSPPSSRFWMGTDNYGRDIYSRVVHGSRISLIVGFTAVAVGVSLGTLWGTLSGFFGGKTDLIIQRFMDAILAIPFLVSAMVIVAILGGGIHNVIIAIAFIQMPRSNRVVRGAVMTAKENQYVEAANAVGATTIRIMTRHILPNVFAPIAIVVSIDLGAAIITEASLSFLGMGVQPPTSTWGGILSVEGREYIEAGPWIAIFPGIAISLTVLAFNIFGDALRDVLDPRLRQ